MEILPTDTATPLQLPETNSSIYDISPPKTFFLPFNNKKLNNKKRWLFKYLVVDQHRLPYNHNTSAPAKN